MDRRSWWICINRGWPKTIKWYKRDPKRGKKIIQSNRWTQCNVKIPATEAGYEAMYDLISNGIS